MARKLTADVLKALSANLGGETAAAFQAMGASAEEAAAGFQALAGALGSSPRNVVLTRRKTKNWPSARIEGKDIHGGHVSVDAFGQKTFEILIKFSDWDRVYPFEAGDTVQMSGKIVKEKISLQVSDKKRQGDMVLLYLKDQINPALRKPPPETEEENLDILYELRQ